MDFLLQVSLQSLPPFIVRLPTLLFVQNCLKQEPLADEVFMQHWPAHNMYASCPDLTSCDYGSAAGQ